MRLLEPFGEKVLYLFIGAVITWILQQYRISRAEEVSLINDHIKDIEKLSDVAQKYWLTSCSDVSADAALAAQVRASHAATSLYYDEIGNICSVGREKYNSLSVELFSLATGGDFEVSGRKMDPSRAMDVHDAAAKLIAHLRSCRRELLQFRRMLTG